VARIPEGASILRGYCYCTLLLGVIAREMEKLRWGNGQLVYVYVYVYSASIFCLRRWKEYLSKKRVDPNGQHVYVYVYVYSASIFCLRRWKE